jgi:hypothetical protein
MFHNFLTYITSLIIFFATNYFVSKIEQRLCVLIYNFDLRYSYRISQYKFLTFETKNFEKLL